MMPDEIQNTSASTKEHSKGLCASHEQIILY